MNTPHNAADLLSALVSIPSDSGAEGPIADFVCAFLARAGIECVRLGDSVVGRVTGVSESPGPRLLLVSHLDTVPVGSGWTADPYDAAWRDDSLVARGANDAKAACVAMLSAAAALVREEFAGELLVALNACEETNGSGMEAVLGHFGMPDAAVVGEPTGLEVVRAQSGLAVLVAEWTGRSCHAAHVTRVAHENALHLAARELAGMEAFSVLPGEHPLLGATTLVPAVLHAGTRHNLVPDHAEATFDARVTPTVDAAACVAWLERHLPRATIRVHSQRLGPVETPADDPLVLAALAASGKAAAIGSNTLSDMALLRGVPAVKCGPGDSARSHTPDEFITRSELLAGCAFYSALAERVLGYRQRSEILA